MRKKRWLALLCALALCCLSLGDARPAMAEEAATEAQMAEEAARKAAEEEAARKAAEEEAARKAAEEEAARKAAEEEAARKAAEEEAARKAAEEEAARKAAEEEAARKAAEEEAARKAAEEEAARKAAEEEAARKAAEGQAETPTEAPTQAPAETPTEAPTQAPAETPAEAPTEIPTEAPTETPTQTPTETPTQTPTEIPTEAPTETPTEAPTQAPAETPTEAPTQAPTEVPTIVPTEEPTAPPVETPVEEPTLVPTVEPVDELIELSEDDGQVVLSGLKASRDTVRPGRKVTFSFEARNADSLTWSALRSDGVYGGSGSAEGGAFSWKPQVSGVYTVTVSARGGDVTLTQQCGVTVRESELQASVRTASRYAVSGDRELCYDVSVTGGCEPYDVSITVDHGGDKLFRSSELVAQVVCRAEGYGENVLTLEVTDATGARALATASILSSGGETNEAPGLPELGEDMTFAERVVKVALSQVGYQEMVENFGYKEDRTVSGWSYYGAWYGMPYEEWCAMFVCYCLDKAGVGKGLMAGSANCNRWKNGLGKRYIDDEDDYIPEPGDLIFFHHDREPKVPNFPNHIGIVVAYDPETDTLTTVEGNAARDVRTREYTRDNEKIVGYASMRYCMKRWDKVYKARVALERADYLTQLCEESYEGGNFISDMR